MFFSKRKRLAKRRAAFCSVLQGLGVEARALERDEKPPEVEEGEDVAGWIDIAEGPIRWVIVHSGLLACSDLYVPDSRLGSYLELGYAEVFARPQRGVRWFYGGPNELEPGDENFYEEVAHFLSQDTTLREAIIFLRVEAEKLTDLSEIQVFPLPEQGCWGICHPSVKTLPLPDWNCYQAIAKALLAMPMPMPAEE